MTDFNPFASEELMKDTTPAIEEVKEEDKQDESKQDEGPVANIGILVPIPDMPQPELVARYESAMDEYEKIRRGRVISDIPLTDPYWELVNKIRRGE